MTTGASEVPAVSMTSMFEFRTPSACSAFIPFCAYLGSSWMLGIFGTPSSTNGPETSTGRSRFEHIVIYRLWDRVLSDLSGFKYDSSCSTCSLL